MPATKKGTSTQKRKSPDKPSPAGSGQKRGKRNSGKSKQLTAGKSVQTRASPRRPVAPFQEAQDQSKIEESDNKHDPSETEPNEAEDRNVSDAIRASPRRPVAPIQKAKDQSEIEESDNNPNPSETEPNEAEDRNVSDASENDKRSLFFEIWKSSPHFTRAAMLKYPLKEKIPDIIDLVERANITDKRDPRYMKTSNLKGELKKKWKVIDVSGNKVLENEKSEPIIAFEDVYTFIKDQVQAYIIRHGKLKNMTHLQTDITPYSANVTGQLIQLYMSYIYKDLSREEALLKLKKEKESKQDKTKENFVEGVEHYTAASMTEEYRKLHRDEETEEDGESESGIANSMNGVGKTDGQLEEETSKQVESTDKDRENSENDSKGQAEVEVDERMVSMSKQNVSSFTTFLTEQKEMDFKKDKVGDPRFEGIHDSFYGVFHHLTGLFNDHEDYKMCGMNSLSMVLMYCLSPETVEMVRRFDYNAHSYQNVREEFVAQVYDAMKLLMARKTEEKIGINCLRKPFLCNLLEIIYGINAETLERRVPFGLMEDNDTLAEWFLNFDTMLWYNSLDIANADFCIPKGEVICMCDDCKAEFVCADMPHMLTCYPLADGFGKVRDDGEWNFEVGSYATCQQITSRRATAIKSLRSNLNKAVKENGSITNQELIGKYGDRVTEIFDSDFRTMSVPVAGLAELCFTSPRQVWGGITVGEYSYGIQETKIIENRAKCGTNNCQCSKFSYYHEIRVFPEILVIDTSLMLANAKIDVVGLKGDPFKVGIDIKLNFEQLDDPIDVPNIPTNVKTSKERTTQKYRCHGMILMTADKLHYVCAVQKHQCIQDLEERNKTDTEAKKKKTKKKSDNEYDNFWLIDDDKPTVNLPKSFGREYFTCFVFLKKIKV